MVALHYAKLSPGKTLPYRASPRVLRDPTVQGDPSHNSEPVAAVEALGPGHHRPVTCCSGPSGPPHCLCELGSSSASQQGHPPIVVTEDQDPMAVLTSRPSWATSWSLLALSCFCPGHCRNADSGPRANGDQLAGWWSPFLGALMRPWLAMGRGLWGGGWGHIPFLWHRHVVQPMPGPTCAPQVNCVAKPPSGSFSMTPLSGPGGRRWPRRGWGLPQASRAGHTVRGQDAHHVEQAAVREDACQDLGLQVLGHHLPRVPTDGQQHIAGRVLVHLFQLLEGGGQEGGVGTWTKLWLFMRSGLVGRAAVVSPHFG